MGSEWKTLSLDQAVLINPPVQLCRGSMYPFVDMQSLDPAYGSVESNEIRVFTGSGSKFCNGDTLLARITPCLENGKIARYVSNGNNHFAHGSTEFIIIRGRNGITDNSFAYYLTKWEVVLNFCISQMTGSSGRQRVPISALSHLKVSIPSLHEQKAISCILGSIDDKIELNRRRNRILESMARTIFQSWFIDFDPVKAKAAGQNPHGLKPEIASLFPDACEESEFGDIPRGWRIGKIDEIAYINAKTLGRGDALDFIDYVEISEVMRGEISTIKRYNRGEEPSRARRRLQHGDTVLSTVRPDRGAYFLALNPIDSLIASTGFVVLTHKAGNWAFLHAFTTREEFCKELGRLADGGAYPAIRPDVVGDRQITIPNEPSLIRAFEKIAQELYFRSEKCKIENRTLISLRDALIPKLISGELRVPDAERIVGRCV